MNPGSSVNTRAPAEPTPSHRGRPPRSIPRGVDVPQLANAASTSTSREKCGDGSDNNATFDPTPTRRPARSKAWIACHLSAVRTGQFGIRRPRSLPAHSWSSGVKATRDARSKRQTRDPGCENARRRRLRLPPLRPRASPVSPRARPSRSTRRLPPRHGSALGSALPIGGSSGSSGRRMAPFHGFAGAQCPGSAAPCPPRHTPPRRPPTSYLDDAVVDGMRARARARR